MAGHDRAYEIPLERIDLNTALSNHKGARILAVEGGVSPGAMEDLVALIMPALTEAKPEGCAIALCPGVHGRGVRVLEHRFDPETGFEVRRPSEMQREAYQQAVSRKLAANGRALEGLGLRFETGASMPVLVKSND